MGCNTCTTWPRTPFPNFSPSPLHLFRTPSGTPSMSSETGSLYTVLSLALRPSGTPSLSSEMGSIYTLAVRHTLRIGLFLLFGPLGFLPIFLCPMDCLWGFLLAVCSFMLMAVCSLVPVWRFALSCLFAAFLCPLVAYLLRTMCMGRMRPDRQASRD